MSTQKKVPNPDNDKAVVRRQLPYFAAAILAVVIIAASLAVSPVRTFFSSDTGEDLSLSIAFIAILLPLLAARRPNTNALIEWANAVLAGVGMALAAIALFGKDVRADEIGLIVLGVTVLLAGPAALIFIGVTRDPGAFVILRDPASPPQAQQEQPNEADCAQPTGGSAT